ncbi:MAG: amidohydrolase family protein [Bacteroidetes bacterium]|nr:amidohydrolase family protein [Bacteroidota bacterium]
MFSLKNLFKALGFVFVITLFVYYTIDTIQYKNNIMSFEDYDPPSSLKVEGEVIKKAKFKFIDVHSHLWNMPLMDLDELVAEMDEVNMGYIVNLSGSGFGPQAAKDIYFDKSTENVNKNQPGRIGLFVNVDFNSIDVENHVENQVNIIRSSVDKGAIGLKVYKSLGLTNKDSKGKRVAVDDERLGPIWEVCGELGIPVLIHSADPFQFWQDKDDQNERWFELKEKPNRYYGDSDFIPPFEDIIKEQHTVFERHKNTTFINAHLGWMGNDLKRLGDHLDSFPNVMTEFGAVIAELGRQPKTARQFFIDYQNRIMFGKDSYNKEEFYTYFRVLESDDEYFSYFRKRHAFWKMYGLNLPDEVLKKVYYKNALKLFPSIDENLFE